MYKIYILQNKNSNKLKHSMHSTLRKKQTRLASERVVDMTSNILD